MGSLGDKYSTRLWPNLRGKLTKIAEDSRDPIFGILPYARTPDDPGWGN